MNFEPSRKRHEVAPFAVNLLRMVGWRFSFTRAAWVHRIGKGRYGPVFVVRDDVRRPSDPTGFAVMTVAESAVAEAEAAVSAAAAAARQTANPVLPRRTPRTTASPTVAPTESKVELTQPTPGPSAEPNITDREEHAESSGWKVDGRPTQPRPRVGPTELHSVPRSGKRASA